MENSKIIKYTGVCLGVGGTITTLIGQYYRQRANMMLKALKDGALLFVYDSSTHRSIDIWNGKLNQGTIVLIVGITIIIIGTIMFYFGYLKANAVKNPEGKVSSMNTVDRLYKLKEAKQLGFITDDEYEMKRKDIMSEL